MCYRKCTNTRVLHQLDMKLCKLLNDHKTAPSKLLKRNTKHAPSGVPVNEWNDNLFGVYIIIKNWTNALLTLRLFKQSTSYVSLVITCWHFSLVQQPTVNCSDHVTMQSVLQKIFTLSTIFVFQTIQNSLETSSLSTEGRAILADEGTMFIWHITVTVLSHSHYAWLAKLVRKSYLKGILRVGFISRTSQRQH